LGRLEEAEAAVIKALGVLKNESLTLDNKPDKNAKAAYLQIQRRIEVALQSKSELSSIENSVRGLLIGSDVVEAGIFNSVWEMGVVDKIALFLTPRDVARLEQTCRGFAAQPERRRRMALSAPLYGPAMMVMEIRAGSKKQFENIRIYCTEKLDDPLGSLRKLVQVFLPYCVSVGPRMSDWMQHLLGNVDHKVAQRNTIQSTICAGKEALRGPLCHWMFLHLSYNCRDLISGPPENDESLRSIFQKDENGQLLRLISWL